MDRRAAPLARHGGRPGPHEQGHGIADLPSQSWTVNRGWVLAANIACDITAWTRLLGWHDQDDLAHAEPETLRYRLWHLPATITIHARQRTLKIAATWPSPTRSSCAGNA
jgi:hypothetical protein